MLQIRHMDSAAGVVLAIAMICFAGCWKSAPAPIDPPPPEVTVSNPVVREVTDYFEFPGQTCAVGEVEIRARVTGYIVKVNFEDGQEVKKGDLLFEIDPRPYQAALDRAQGELTRLKAVLVKGPRPTWRAQTGCVPRGQSARTSMNNTWPNLRLPRPPFNRPKPRSATRS